MIGQTHDTSRVKTWNTYKNHFFAHHLWLNVCVEIDFEHRIHRKRRIISYSIEYKCWFHDWWLRRQQQWRKKTKSDTWFSCELKGSNIGRISEWMSGVWVRVWIELAIWLYWRIDLLACLIIVLAIVVVVVLPHLRSSQNRRKISRDANCNKTPDDIRDALLFRFVFWSIFISNLHRARVHRRPTKTKTKPIKCPLVYRFYRKMREKTIRLRHTLISKHKLKRAR